MALSYTNVQTISQQTQYQLQMAVGLLKEATSRIGSATGNELALCVAIIKSPISYAPRFLIGALLLNAAGLTSTNGSTLDTAPTDAQIDTVVQSMWTAQAAAGA